MPLSTLSPSDHPLRGLRAEPLPVVRIGIVGLGQRGQTALRLLMLLRHARVTALCDACGDVAAEAMQRHMGSRAQAALCSGAEGYLDLCSRTDVDLVYICSDWESHARVAMAAMRCGKHVAIEVPAAVTLSDIEALVATAEATRRHCTLLENCLYDTSIAHAIEAVGRGEAGRVVHAEGSYYHQLAGRWTPWRIDINRRLRGDLYPTHAFGPICKALGIGSRDHLTTLVAMDSAAVTGQQVYARQTGHEPEAFANADHTLTLVHTALGTTILLRHDVLTPQPYDRSIAFVGTHGRIEAGHELEADAQEALESVAAGVRPSMLSAHDPLTYEMNRRLVEALHLGGPLDVDAYEMAAWSAVGPLSRASIEGGSVPVAFPRHLQ